MARRSGSSRWSRPATGKQIAALKAHGSYDGKYYSMGRASQAIGGSGRRSSSGGSRSGSSPWRGSSYSPLAASGFGPSGLLSGLLGGADSLDSLLQPALGPIPQSRLASSGSGPTSLLSQLLGVPEDLDSLVQVAMGADDPDGSNAAPGDDPVESVLYTVRSDDSDPAEPRIVVEAEVVRDSAFDGHPSVQVRFVDATEHGGHRPLWSAAGPTLGYRPTWSPVLVRTPSDLAEQMRVRWGDAMEELRAGVDPRMATFLAGFPGMEVALTVLNSAQPPAAKLVLLQGILDPDGPIQFQGLGLDAATFAEQIRLANEGDEDSLTWLETIQREQVLTSLAEVTGAALAAEADFRLSSWYKQGMDLIEAVTMNAKDAEFDFSIIRSILTMQAQTRASNQEARAHLAAIARTNPQAAERIQLIERRISVVSIDSDVSRDYVLLEDWFFEETKIYLRARFRQSLPGQFAVALTSPPADGRDHAALAGEVRRLGSEASTEPNDYSDEPVPGSSFGYRPSTGLLGGSIRSDPTSRDRIQRIIQAVRRVVADAEAAEPDDLGTLVVAQEVLTYAQWKRDELRAGRQAHDAAQQRSAALERSREAEQRSDAASRRHGESRDSRGAARDLEQVVQQYADELARATGSITIQNPVPKAMRSAAGARLEQAMAREAAAGEWLVAAEERERWAVAEEEIAATPRARELLRAEREAAVAEQSRAKAEQQAAHDEQQTARRDITLANEARAKFKELIRPVHEENENRLRAEAEPWSQEMERKAEVSARRAEEQRKRQAAGRERQEAANRRQEELNQRQQDRARAAKAALVPELERLLALPDSAPVWRRKSLAATRSSLEQSILKLQTGIASPLAPPRTKSTTWPNMLSRNERYLGTVKKLADYGAFVSLPAGADGLLRGSDASPSLSAGQLVIVEIVDMPYGKPIALKLVPR